MYWGKMMDKLVKYKMFDILPNYTGPKETNKGLEQRFKFRHGEISKWI